ncbi:MAG: hypothetical protein LUD14_07485 [Clostridiales bacterium]|nr:hypothetical protein [Clostridiales bacterium]
MTWDDQMYIGKGCRNRYRKLQNRISDGLSHPCVFLIVLGQSEHAVLEIIPSLFLLQKDYPREGLHVIGMGATRREAYLLAADIVAGTLALRGDTDVEAYMRQTAN